MKKMSSGNANRQAFIFTSRGDDKLSNAIALFSSPTSWWLQLQNVPSHTGILFTDATGKGEYFESHSPEGWRGPKPKAKLEDWVAKGGKRWVRYRRLDLTPEEVHQAYLRCSDKLMDPDWMDYPEHQILQMAKARLFKRPIRRSKGVICSEAVGKILYPFYDLRLWGGKRPITFDEITPWRCQVIPLIRRGEELI